MRTIKCASTRQAVSRHLLGIMDYRLRVHPELHHQHLHTVQVSQKYGPM
jgi:hypothetical protein